MFVAGAEQPWQCLPRRPKADVWETELGVSAATASVELAEAEWVSNEWEKAKEQVDWWVMAVKASVDMVERDVPEGLHHVLDKFSDVFQPPSRMPPADRPQHVIQTLPGARPVLKAPRRLSEPQRAALQEQVGELLRKGWIRPSTSPWGSLVILVPKKDGSLRLCVDYRDVNATTQREGTPLPRIDVILEKLARSRWYSKMDLESGFH